MLIHCHFHLTSVTLITLFDFPSINLTFQTSKNHEKPIFPKFQKMHITQLSFARPGSALVGGGKKGEFRNWTGKLFPSHFRVNATGQWGTGCERCFRDP